MAHSHYVVDLYYPASGKSGGLQREVLRIEAASDTEAIDEAHRICGWRQPVRYDVRAITGSARSGDRLIHASVAKPEPVDDAGAAETSSAAQDSTT